MKKKRSLAKYLKYWQLYLLILPAVIYVLIFSYQPMYGIIIAFKNYKPKLGYWGSEWVGLKYFIRFLTYPEFWELMRNTLFISLYSLATFPLAIILALLLNEMKNGVFKRAVQMITYAPHFLSTVVICGLVIMVVGRQGPLGNLYTFFTGESQNLLAVPEYFRHIYVWSGVWQNIGWGTIIYLSALAGVSMDLVESAKIDGAKRHQVIWYINIPCIMPTIAITFIMRIGSLLSVGYEKILLFQNDLNAETSRVISTYVYDLGILGGQLSYSTAIGLFNNVINVCLLIVANKIVKKLSGTGMF